MPVRGKLLAEAVGTFFLCFIGAGSICLTTMQGGAGPGLLGVAIAHGLILSIAVSATMNISGGHVNPAVTFAMLVTGRVTLTEAVSYVLAQLAGATIAGLLVLAIFRGLSTPNESSVVLAAQLGTPALHPKISFGMGILIESILTFLLVFAVFGTAVDPRAPKIGGFGIGLTIAADILVGGPLTGAAMNPARTFGPGIIAYMSGNHPTFWSQHYVYWVGPIIGATLAALIYDSFIMEAKKPA